MATKAQMLNEARVLILGAGQIGLSIAHIAAQQGAQLIHLHALTKSDVECAKLDLQSQYGHLQVGTSWGDLFHNIGAFSADGQTVEFGGEHIDLLSVMSAESIKQTRVYRVITSCKPTHIVDSTNSATTLSDAKSLPPSLNSLPNQVIYHLSLASALEALKRYICSLEHCLSVLNVTSFVKVSTTGLGGLGLRLPFTHGDLKTDEYLSPALWGKLYLSGVTHQLLWALNRSIHCRVHVIVPGTCVGFEEQSKVLVTPLIEQQDCIKANGTEIFLYDCRVSESDHVPVIRSGENSLYALQELLLLTDHQQMGAITKEEVANSVIEALIGNPHFDIIIAMQNATMTSSFLGSRASEHFYRRLRREEIENKMPSIATGNLGPNVACCLFELRALRLSLVDQKWSTFAISDPEQIAYNATQIVANNKDLLRAIFAAQLIVVSDKRIFAPVNAKQMVADILSGEQLNPVSFVDLRVQRVKYWQTTINHFYKEFEYSQQTQPRWMNEWLADPNIDEGTLLASLF